MVCRRWQPGPGAFRVERSAAGVPDPEGAAEAEGGLAVGGRFLAALVLLAALLAGCGAARGAASGGRPAVANPGGPVVEAGGTLLAEPGAGATSYVDLIRGATHAVEVNSYLLTDHRVVAALIADARRGVRVRAIVAGNPYRDAAAMSQEQAEFRGSGVAIKTAPARFEGRYVFDHAKYVVADPGQSDQAAILGSSNLDYSGLGGGSREYDWKTKSAAVVAALDAVFRADWGGTKAGKVPRRTLVVSPGAQPALLGLIDHARRRLWIESEEMGDVPQVLAAIEARARAGVQVEVVLPRSLSSTDRGNAAALKAAGAKVVLLDRPYPHAKLIVADDRVFLGSENFSRSSLDRNREVGIVLGGGPAGLAAAAFRKDFAAGQPLNAANAGDHAPSGYLPSGRQLYGKTEAEVRQSLGNPERTYSTSYHGRPEMAWVYPDQRVYFGADAQVVYVSHQPG